MKAPVDLKRTPEDQAADTPDVSRQPDYSWGTSIELRNPELAKLGITQMPQMGTELMIAGKARVTAMRADGDGKCLSLQITHLAVDDGATAPRKSTASVLYGPDTDNDGA